MIVTVGSVRGSPGVTSWSLLSAVAWPPEFGTERVVLEADPAGGVLGARYGLGVDPGAVSLIAGLRRGGDSIPVETHGRACGGVWVVPGPESGEQARSVWASAADAVAPLLAVDERVWVVDAGRLDSVNPSLAFVAASTLTVLLCRAVPEDLVSVPARIAALRAVCGDRIGVLVIGRAAHDRVELAGFFDVPTVWTVRETDDLAGVVGSVLSGASRARRAWVWRTALEVTAEIAEHAHRSRRLEAGEAR